MLLLLIIIMLFFIPLTGLAGGWWCTVLEMREPGLLQRLLFRPGNVRKPQARCASVEQGGFLRVINVGFWIGSDIAGRLKRNICLRRCGFTTPGKSDPTCPK